MKILVSDYDETFAYGKQLEENRKAVQNWRDAGNLFVIATGRTYGDFFSLFEQNEPIPCDYVILNHGATILDCANQVLYAHPIDPKVISNLQEYLPVLFTYPNNFYSSIKESRVLLDHPHVTKLHIACNSVALAKQYQRMVEKSWKQDLSTMVISRSGSLELVASGVNKASAIEVLLRKLSLPRTCVYTVGDDYNDLEMLILFHGASMMNATSEVYQQIPYHVPSVASYINMLLQEP